MSVKERLHNSFQTRATGVDVGSTENNMRWEPLSPHLARPVDAEVGHEVDTIHPEVLTRGESMKIKFIMRAIFTICAALCASSINCPTQITA